ncbi:uncharacterized protein M421DRAFT_416208 [Didymella exigua CBS 183.55]|uniref:Myb-like domain-containing protein n=1 Tax=Didymella exigua CBS 183.55 TaxID=1150837 RepID=A0A6A5RVT3_9PLEO|nr:uncharacterized protein M421DRAFT_416208 [Didymella exigua CBS 183.55]KAF1932585.1 hypothetical protein M421DRAFT_416208 [Didymella exigua CBS 183.55]
MAGDVRGVRAGSRRKTPTPRPEKAPVRARRLRSQSRDIEPIPEVQKPTRRTARQRSVASVASESENEGLKKRNNRRPAKQAVGELTIVEEVGTEIHLDEAPATPQRVDIPLPLEQQTFRSPGAVSEMSGTTAISSFSMIEAEFLEPKFIQKHVRKLCDSAMEFLDHLAPRGGSMEEDLYNITEMLKPGSEFAEEYSDFDEEFRLHLKHFKGDESNYINPRAIHRALFGSYTDAGGVDSGVNLVLYLANILVFAKQMIHSDRSDKDVWNHLRLLDSSFPSQFMRSLRSNGSPTAAGDSALLEGTFKLALDLRIQVTILSLERSAGDDGFNPDEALDGIFLQEQEGGDILRGWSVAALGGEESRLTEDHQKRIAEHYNTIRAYFPFDGQSLQDGHVVDLDRLGSEFPWKATILCLLDWVRARRNELSASIDMVGGSAAILANIRQAVAALQPVPAGARPSTAPRDSPRKKRASFGRQRRRSSRKFDPNAPVDLGVIDALKARERDSGVHFDPKDPQSGDVFVEVAQEEEAVEEAVEEEVEAEAAPEDADAERELSEQIAQTERTTWDQTLGGDDQQAGEATLVAGDDESLDINNVAPSGPPKSTQEILAALKSVQPAGKENRKAPRFVDRQATAQRVDFGSGFDSSQGTPGPSTRVLDKGKQRAEPPPSVPKKRRRAESEDDDVDDDDEAYETSDRTSLVQERRQKAPVSKRRRVEPPSSAPAPPSHQPERASQPADAQLRLSPSHQRAPASSAPTARAIEHEESRSEPEARDTTDPPPRRSTSCAPPSSQYPAQHVLSLQNSRIGGAGSVRQPRRTWTSEQEDAFIFYMEVVGPSWRNILLYDKGAEGYGELEEFTQVNLKDKARTMAVNMIKSGTGLRTGFERIVTAVSKEGRKLIEAGFTW